MDQIPPVGRYDTEIERERIRALVARARDSVVANVGGIAILIGMTVFVPFAQTLIIGILLRMMAVSVTGLNTAATRRAIEEGAPVTPMVHRFAAGLSFAGLTWMALLFCIPLEAYDSHAAVVLFATVTTGVVLVIAVTSAIPLVMWSFVAGIMIGMIAWIFHSFDVFGWTGVATVGALMLSAISCAFALNRQSTDSAQLIVDNRRLAERMTHLNDEYEAALAEKDHLATHDTLTALPNRRAFERTLAEVIGTGEKSDWTLLLFDLDHFKRINDHAGHAGGDEVLRAFGMLLHAMADALPDAAQAARLGGEEFALLAKGLSDEAAGDLALAACARTRVIPAPSGYDGRVTTSIGVARWHEGESADRLLRRADDALYQAKRDGRDRYLIAEAAPDPDLFAAG